MKRFHPDSTYDSNPVMLARCKREPTPPISYRAIFIGTLPFIPVWLKFHDQDLNTDRMLMITTRAAWDAMVTRYDNDY